MWVERGREVRKRAACFQWWHEREAWRHSPSLAPPLLFPTYHPPPQKKKKKWQELAIFVNFFDSTSAGTPCFRLLTKMIRPSSGPMLYGIFHAKSKYGNKKCSFESI